MTRAVLSPAERLDRSVSEDDLLAFVAECLTLYKWLWNHPHDSRRSNPGLPDIVATRGGRVIFCELKSQVGRVSQAQEAWLAELRKNSCVETYLWRPSDMRAIAETLR